MTRRDWGPLSFLRRLLYPTVPEPVRGEHWRRLEMTCLVMPVLFAAMNLLPLLRPASAEPAMRAAYLRFLAWNLPAHVLIVLASAAALRWARQDRHHLLYGRALVFLLVWTCTVGLWIGSLAVNLVGICLVIGTARLAFDSRLGLFAFGSALVQVTGLFLLQIAGRTPPPAILTAVGPVGPFDLFVNWFWEVNLFFWVWLCASYAAARYRASEYALAVERAEARRTVAEAVAVAGVGRLTGGVLDGRYRLEELLGRGGMGEVYAAQRLAGGDELAIKVLHPHLTGDPTLLERFRREAEVVARLSSSFVPTVHEVGVSPDGEWFIVMSRLRGEDLAQHIRRTGRLDPAEAARLVARIAAALDSLHAAGVVHRDLKPQNVFLSPGADGGPEVRLLDFGIVRFADHDGAADLTATSALLGSPGYLSPEQVLGPPAQVGPATDVFGLGVIAYRALTGHDAFPARHVAGAVYEALHHHPPPPSSRCPALSTDVDDVLTLALAKSPADRYPSAGALAHDLARAVEGGLDAATRARAARLRPREATLTRGETPATVAARPPESDDG